MPSNINHNTLFSVRSVFVVIETPSTLCVYFQHPSQNITKTLPQIHFRKSSPIHSIHTHNHNQPTSPPPEVSNIPHSYLDNNHPIISTYRTRWQLWVCTFVKTYRKLLSKYQSSRNLSRSF